jgi:hypothetical protein
VTDMASRFPKSTPATEHVATVRPYASSPTGTQLTSCRDALEQCEGRARVSTRVRPGRGETWRMFKEEIVELRDLRLAVRN